MLSTPIAHPAPAAPSGKIFQWLAVLLCVLFSLAMIVNTQLGGEAMWFWYCTVFHNGVKLYSGMHIALQPFYVLEATGWMDIVGKKIMAIETLSLLHVLAMCLALYLVLRESDWPDWQKAVALFGAFALTVSGASYRFDDYHVVAEAQIFFALAILLLLARARTARLQFGLVAVLGFLCGITITTRVTDGAALLLASLLCVPILLKKGRLASLALFVVMVMLTVLLTVHLTGDTFSSYIYSSIIRAAGSKGGTGSIFAAPFRVVLNTLKMFSSSYKRTLLAVLLVVALTAFVSRRWKACAKYIPLLLIAFLLLVLAFLPWKMKVDIVEGGLINFSVLLLTLLMYALPIVVLVRYISARRAGRAWDTREVLVVLPLLEWASYSAGAAAEPLTNYYAPVALLLLLVPVLTVFRGYRPSLNLYYTGYIALIALSSISGKIIQPYFWENYSFSPMFENRQWYHHPVFGEMYIDTDLLHFSQAVCTDIQADPGKNAPELLSLPYPFPNYFCDTPPWHNYVQTFFDTSPRATVERLMDELNTAPPQYIVYQRQLNIIAGVEQVYNHGQPLVQRALDTLIMQKIQSGQWQLIEKRHYLKMGEGWYIIRTR